MGGCKLTNVWWSAVCEDAFTIKKQEAGETTTISGGGAFGAEDKVLQHNGGGTMSVSGFTVDGESFTAMPGCTRFPSRAGTKSSATIAWSGRVTSRVAMAEPREQGAHQQRVDLIVLGDQHRQAGARLH